MKRIVQKIKSYSKSIELSEGDKDDLRAHLVTFIENHPIQEVSSTATVIKSPYQAVLFRYLKNPFTICALVALIAGGSITYAAEKTLPGDLLYPIKIHLNENVYESFALTNKAEAVWYTEKAERRFEEIEKLIAQGELDKEKTSIIQTHLDNALKDADISANPVAFGIILDAHAGVLAKIDSNHVLASSTVHTSINEIRKVNTKKKYSTYTQTPSTTTEDIILTPTLATASEKKELAKARMDLINERLSELDLEKDIRNRVNVKTKRALEAFTRGSEALDNADYTLARDEFIESMMYMQEAKLIASVPKFLGVEEETENRVEELQKNIQESVDSLLPL